MAILTIFLVTFRADHLKDSVMYLSDFVEFFSHSVKLSTNHIQSVIDKLLKVLVTLFRCFILDFFCILYLNVKFRIDCLLEFFSNNSPHIVGWFGEFCEVVYAYDVWSTAS